MENGQPASFSAALEQLYKLHTKEIEDLQAKLALQNEQFKEKERQLQIMKVNVTKAKKKVKQQTGYIRQLESQLGIPHKLSQDKTLNKTALPLFEESPISIVTSTPGVRRNNPSNTTTPNTRNHVANSDQSKIGTEEVKVSNPCESASDGVTHAESASGGFKYAESTSDGESTDMSQEESEVMIVDMVENGEGSVLQKDQTDMDETGLVVNAPQTCISLFEHSVKTSPRRPLQLKRASNKSGRIQYKQTTTNTSPESTTSTNCDDSASSKKSPSILGETDLVSPSVSESNSPPFIGTSPYKTPPPSSVRNPGMSVSIFQSVLEDDEMKTPSTAGRNLPIPPSDSQFSLDVSQSIPPSPELCGASTRTSTVLKPKNLKRQLVDMPEEDVKYSSVSSKHRKIESPPSPSNPTVIMKTPALPHTTVIPVTPGIQTVDNILSKGSNYTKHSVAQGIGRNTGTRQKQTNQRPAHIEEKNSLQTSQDWEEVYSDFDDEDSPILVYSTKKPTSAEDNEDVLVDKDDQRMRARELARKAKLPEYACVTKILGKADRAKLDGKACPECHQWYDGTDGIHDGQRQHLRHTCRHKHLYQPPDTDPRIWDISMPSSVECDRLMDKRR